MKSITQIFKLFHVEISKWFVYLRSLTFFVGVENGGFEQDPDGSLEIDHPYEIVNPEPEINNQNNEANINVFEAMLNEASEIEPGNGFF